MVLEYARQGGFPVNIVSEVKLVIDPYNWGGLTPVRDVGQN